ncbi:MAG TPA: FAD binding domain-containing protein [Pyrinomonadaceae bacterium]
MAFLLVLLASDSKPVLKYFRATGISEAAAAVVAGAKPLAGGTVLVPNLAANGGRDRTVVDIGRIPELRKTWADDLAIYLGSTVSLHSISADPSIRSNFRALAEAADAVGNPQVRRAATIGGNVALDLATTDLVPALVALDGSVVSRDEAKSQETPISIFAATNRLITSLKLPNSRQRRSGFRKFAWRRASGITIVNVAVSVCIDEGLVSDSRVVAGGFQKKPQRLTAAESILNGQLIDLDLAAKSAVAAEQEVSCDLIGPPGEKYRRRLLEYGVKEILAQLINGDV